LRVIIQRNYKRLSRWAAHYVAARIRQFEPSDGRPFVLGLPTGSTPLGMYERLIKLHEKDKLSFRHVVTFNMDEYVGLDEDHPQSYRDFMWKNLFQHVDIRPQNVNIPDGNADDLAAECEAYESKIEAAGGVHLFVGGIGQDGHLAFNEPGSSLSSRTRVKTLTEETRRANARFFGGDVDDVPKQALTVGIGTIMDAEEVMILASGQSKARALRHVIEEGINHMWTASILQMHRRAIIVCDEEATAELRAGTVRYFKQIERDHLKPLRIRKLGLSPR
jgi:glucosamine-6-phosphate deaminase